MLVRGVYLATISDMRWFTTACTPCMRVEDVIANLSVTFFCSQRLVQLIALGLSRARGHVDVNSLAGPRVIGKTYISSWCYVVDNVLFLFLIKPDFPAGSSGEGWCSDELARPDRAGEAEPLEKLVPRAAEI
jgi:hypothetical protein